MNRLAFNVFRLALVTLGWSSVLTSCNSSTEPEGEVENIRNDIQLSASSRAAADELKDFYQKFTIDAINTVDADPNATSSNVIVSPLSASMMLGMLANGVENEVATRISEYLGVSDLAALNALAANLIEALPNADKKSKLSISNSVWHNDKFLLNSSFSSTISRNFMATLRPIDFSQSSALNTVNDWVSSTTGGVIDSYFDYSEINANTVAVLLNTLYFNGEWAHTYFNPQYTVSEPFHGFSGESAVEMMHCSIIRTQYGANDRFKACTLYFGNAAFRLTLVLPTAEATRKTDMPEISVEELEALTASDQFPFITLSLPKFKLSNSTDLNDVLETAGLSEINGNVTFTMFDNPMNNPIELRQGASLSVDEEGAKVAAASSGELVYSAPTPEYKLEFNRPFYFFLTETSTGACLLSGRIADFSE